MSQIINAIYENGLLRPLKPLNGVAEHETVSVEQGAKVHPLINYCGTISDEDAREIEQIISDEFEKVNPDEWQ